MTIHHPFADSYSPVTLPDHTHVVRMSEPEPLTSVAQRIRESLEHPIDSDSLKEIALRAKVQRKAKDGGNAQAVIVVSDKTRPVPYRGKRESFFRSSRC